MKKAIIYEEALENDISKIDYYIKEENDYLKKIQNCMENINSYYDSGNNKLLDNTLDKTITNFHDIKLKRSKYNNILRKVIKRYNATVKQVKTNIKKDIKKVTKK